METNASEIGRLMREERKKKGLTQASVSQAAGIAVNSLRLYEAGKRKPNIETLIHIAEALGVDPYSIMDFDTASERICQRINGELQGRILSAFNSLNEVGQQKAIERVEELAEIPKYQICPPLSDTDLIEVMDHCND